jgi:hypothetical protein
MSNFILAHEPAIRLTFFLGILLRGGMVEWGRSGYPMNNKTQVASR